MSQLAMLVLLICCVCECSFPAHTVFFSARRSLKSEKLNFMWNSWLVCCLAELKVCGKQTLRYMSLSCTHKQRHLEVTRWLVDGLVILCCKVSEQTISTSVECLHWSFVHMISTSWSVEQVFICFAHFTGYRVLCPCGHTCMCGRGI